MMAAIVEAVNSRIKLTVIAFLHLEFLVFGRNSFMSLRFFTCVFLLFSV